MLPIKGFIETSFVDFEGKILSVLFIGGCNFKCPYCHNPELIQAPHPLEAIPLETINHYLREHKDFIDGVCLSGGEPLLYEEVKESLGNFKRLGFLIKLDTNGTYPHLLRRIIDQRLVDYVAMDIKAPLTFSRYSQSVGVKERSLFEGVIRSIEILMRGDVDYEFRTTVVPALHTEKEIEEIASYIKGAKRFVLQNFRPHHTLHPTYEKIKPYSIEEIRRMGKIVAKYVEEVKIRENR
jgi:pyruvate formate lyase activating enzyme